MSTCSLLPLYQRPMLRLTDGALMPLNWRLLLNRVYAGLYWAMQTVYIEAGGDAVQDWMGQIGKILFQPYIDRRMRDIYDRPGSPGRYLSEEDVGPYERDGKAVDGADGYVVERGRLIVADVTASAIPVITMMSADGKKFREDVRRFLINGKLAQLNRVINDLLSGRLVLPDVELADIIEIVPVVITATGFPQFPNIWSAVRDMWTRAQLFGRDARIVAPQMLSFEELELMQASLAQGTLSLSDVLMQRERTYTGGSVKNYLARSGVELHKSERSDEVFTRFRVAVVNVMRGLGVPEA